METDGGPTIDSEGKILSMNGSGGGELAAKCSLLCYLSHLTAVLLASSPVAEYFASMHIRPRNNYAADR